MRFRELIEAPISDFVVGDLSGIGDLTHADPKAREYLNNPKYQAKVQQVWQKTPFDFKLYFANVGIGTLERRLKVSGVKTIAQVEEYWPELKGMIKPDSNAISLLYISNDSTDFMPFTPWMLAHRFTHALMPYLGQSQAASLYGVVSKELLTLLDSTLREVYGIFKPENMNQYGDFTNVEKELLNQILTTKAAREQRLKFTDDFIAEMIAQYLITGAIKFNSLPNGMRNYVELGYDFKTHADPDRLGEFNQIWFKSARMFERFVVQILNHLKGKVAVY